MGARRHAGSRCTSGGDQFSCRLGISSSCRLTASGSPPGGLNARVERKVSHTVAHGLRPFSRGSQVRVLPGAPHRENRHGDRRILHTDDSTHAAAAQPGRAEARQV